VLRSPGRDFQLRLLRACREIVFRVETDTRNGLSHRGTAAPHWVIQNEHFVCAFVGKPRKEPVRPRGISYNDKLTPEAELTEPLNETPAKRVSVVIVTHNRAADLRKSLTALGDSHQVLVVDNGSTDDTPGLETEFPSARFIRLPKNFGTTKALNIGVRAAEGTSVLFLHDDTVISGENVTKLADFLEERQDVGAVCPVLTDERGQRVRQVRALPTTSDADPKFEAATGGGEIQASCVSGAAILFRTFYLRALRHIDERYGSYGSEIDLCAQVKRSSRKLIVLAGVPAVHYWRESPVKKSALAGDRAVGTAVFLGKQYGFLSGMLYRLKAGLGGLATFRFGAVAGALGDVKIDGTG
jgi:GT2 family glycosyltransferase